MKAQTQPLPRTKRTCVGVVVSDRMDKTIVVEVQRLTRHPMYGKVMRRSSKVKAHDEANECRQGDRVEITECRPLSKEKTWRVSKILARAR